MMAKGKSCPECGSPMYAEREDNQPQGRWVTYVCQSASCPTSKASGGSQKFKDRVFEQYRDRH
jgi:hypothetical protein